MSISNNPISNSNPKYMKNISNNNNQLFQNEPNLLKKEKICKQSEKIEQTIFLEINSEKDKNQQLYGPLKKEKDVGKQLLYYFKDKKIYIEIYNGNLNSSQIFYNLLLKYKIIQCKKLSKKIDYIVFKDGHLKTRKYAFLNNIKMVNPLWIDDKINKHIFKEDKEYEIKENSGDIILNEKNKNNDNNKKDIDILNKNFDLELEVEYDTEYANMIDKLRQNYSEIADENDIVTTSLTNNNFNYHPTQNKTKNDKDTSYLEIEREKRISSSNKLENRKTIIYNNKNNDNVKNKKNEKSIFYLSKDKSKYPQKKINKNKKKKSNSVKKSDKNSDNKKKDNENNYVLDFKEKEKKILSLPKNKSNLEKINLINIIAYKLEENEIQYLKELSFFEFKGNLSGNIEKDKILYNNANVIIVEYEKVIYESKLYEFLMDKKIIIDFASFLFELENNDIDTNTLFERIYEISINNKCYFFNKKKRIQKRTMIQSLKIIDNIISKDKKELNDHTQNETDNKFYFLINQDINDNEKKVLHKLLKNYLKANIINPNISKVKSVTNQNNKKKKYLKVINEEDKYLKETKNKNDSKDKEKYENFFFNDNTILNVKENININKIRDDKNNIEKTYLISKENINNKKFLKKIKYYKGVISYRYIYDSFLKGELLDLNEQKIYNKYKLDLHEIQ